MRGMMLGALCALALIACAAQAPQQTATVADTASVAEPTATTVRAAPGDRLPERVCEKQKVMGSIMPRTVCRSRTQATAEKDAADQYVKDKADYDAVNDNRSFER